MEKAKFPVRFMGKHPVFGKSARTRGADGKIKATASGVPFRQSPYYWWWYALRLSDSYRAVCEAKGKTTDAKLAQLYADFGDVITTGFEPWWRERGERLFAERSGPQKVVVLGADELELFREPITSGQSLVVAIPMFLTKREIATAVKKIVSSHHKGAKGKNAISTRLEHARAKYKLHNYKDIGSISRALEVFEKRQQGVKLKDLKKTELEELSAVSRFERKGRLIVKGVEQGEFPVLAG